jgi:hypothetical protein
MQTPNRPVRKSFRAQVRASHAEIDRANPAPCWARILCDPDQPHHRPRTIS